MGKYSRIIKMFIRSCGKRTGVSITYDALGNQTDYNYHRMTWNGRLLVSGECNNGDTEFSFTYNDEGIRTSKTVDGVTTPYYYSGTQLIGEETNGNLTVYLYDASGSPIGPIPRFYLCGRRMEYILV